MSISSYSKQEILSIYELGRMYYEMGYFVPAERIFSGLCLLDNKMTLARCGLGLVKLERGLLEQAEDNFRIALQDGVYTIEAKLGMVSVFIAKGQIARAKTLLLELVSELEVSNDSNATLRRLWEAFAIRCDKV